MYRVFVICFVLLISCNNERTLDITKEEIDEHVSECLDTSIIYDIIVGPRYSREDESYQVTEYSQYDTVTLYASEEYSEHSSKRLNVFYKDELPVFVEEYISIFSESSTESIERNIYLNGRDIIYAEERKALNDYDLDQVKFKVVELNREDYDLDKPANAVYQKDEFEMQFTEFLIINPESYLILKNPESGYSVALYILEGDEMLDELFAKPLEYQGKTVRFSYEFANMNGIERLIYRGVEIIEKEDPS